MFGENGNDTIIVLEGEFSDNVDGGSGTDTLDLSNITSHGATVNSDTGTWDLVPTFGGPNTIASIRPSEAHRRMTFSPGRTIRRRCSATAAMTASSSCDAVLQRRHRPIGSGDARS